MKKSPRIGIVGMGAVGNALHHLFGPLVYAMHDEPLQRYEWIERNEDGTWSFFDEAELAKSEPIVARDRSRERISRCDFVFVAVPTPMQYDGRCDASIVKEVVEWIGGDLVKPVVQASQPVIVIRSTVQPNVTKTLRAKTGKRLVFQPKYGPGETPDHPFRTLRDVRWAILGGLREDTAEVADLYQRVFSSDIQIVQTDSTTAELTKYMENAFLAVKVAFCHEFYVMAKGLDVDYRELRELWLLDPRIGRSHTFVNEDDPGFGGKCLPKDLAAILAVARDLNMRAPVLESTWAWAQLPAMKEPA